MTARRQTLLALGSIALAAPLAPFAQQRPKIYRVGILMPPREAGGRPFVDALRGGLRDLGYVEGKNLTIDLRFADDDLSRLPGLAADMVRHNPDVIVTASPPGVRAAMAATPRIPIVIGAVFDPVGLGFVASLARPGGNVTGLSVQYEDTVSKLLELIRAVAPEARKVAVLRTAEPSHDTILTRMAALARPLHIEIVSVGANAPADIDGAFAKIGDARVDALIVLPHPLFNTRASAVVELAGTRRLLAIYPFRSYATVGGLMSLGVDLPDSFRRAAYYVHRILTGANPADLPIEQPNRVELVINLKTARAFGLTIPQSLLLRADSLIE